MSIGALHELTKACIEKFKSMAADLPKSEKKHVIKIFQKHVEILEGMQIGHKKRGCSHGMQEL